MRHKSSIFRRMFLVLFVAVLGFVLGGFGLFIYWVGSGPALELWHTEELTAEFTAEKASEIPTFDDYRQLEETLFAELDEKVYARTETGPAFEIARYSAGSAADPQRRKPNWNRSFEFPAEAPAGGVLLLHGMSDSPYSLRTLGETLNDRGYWVVGLRLPGHGTVPSGLKSVQWEDMAAAVRLGMEHLESKVARNSIHMVGYSTGAPLALDYALLALGGATEPAPASLVLISPAIGISPAAALAKWKGRLAVIPGLEKAAWASILPEFDPYKYNSFAINAGDQVHSLTRSVARDVQAKAASGPIKDFPSTLVFLSTVDATVSTDSVVDNLLRHLAPDGHELFLFDINRRTANTTVLISDPGPLTAQLIADTSLPFSLTLITNENSESTMVVRRTKGPFATEISTEPLNVAWPKGVFSLSHIALPFPPDDPLYGQSRPEETDSIFLGKMAIQGERGLLLFSADWLLRLRYNPFYDYLENRVVEWLDGAGAARPDPASKK